MTAAFTLSTGERTALIDITARAAEIVAETGIAEGLCVVSSPHTTAGITVNENADPTVKRDVLMELGKIVPEHDGYLHAEGNSAAHLKATLTGLSASIPITGGRLALGTWQGVYFCEFDGPRRREVRVTVIPG